MKRAVFLLILLAAPASSEDAAAVAERALLLFEEARMLRHDNPVAAREGYLEAAAAFELLAGEHGAHNAALHHNAGNAWFLAGDMGRAILHYRQALRFEPGDAATLRNLSDARKRRRDIIQSTAPRRVFRTVLFWHYDFPIRFRAGLFIAAYVLAWAVAALGLHHKRTELRWALTGCAASALLLAGSVLLEAAGGAGRLEGVILASEVTVRAAAGATHPSAFAAPLHAGAEFAVTGMDGDWCAIELSDGRAGWVPVSATAFLE